MNRWYFPSWSGDFRLLSDARGTVLEIVDPTSIEREGIAAFLKVARKKKWTRAKRVVETGTQEIELDVDLFVAGRELLPFVKPAARTITAISSKGGELTVVDSAALVGEVVDTPPVEAEKAVSVACHTPCCPQCVPGPSRASEVLDAFLTPEERDLWAREQCLVVVGGISGHRYCLAHRHSEKAQRIGRICFDLDDRIVVHFHDNAVPPEEEVLAAKLVLEHREPWLRNEATCLGGEGTDVYKNPFGDHLDGVADSAAVSAVGMLLMVRGGVTLP